MLEVPDSLVDRLKAREAALVAGLGCGELAGAAGWPALVGWIATRLPFPDDRAHVMKLLAAGRLVDAVVLLRDLLAHGVVGDAIREGYPDGAAIPDALAQAAGLPWRAFVTTGFDDLWQRALAGARGEQPAPEIADGTDTMARLRSFGPRPVLMHLFGHVAVPDSLCLGPGDARARLVPAGGLTWLGELYRRRSLVLVGFRSRDPDLAWLTSWLATAPLGRTQHFIFLDVSGEAEPDVEARLLALRTGLTVIPCPGGTPQAVERLAELARELGQNLPPLDADVDLDAWLARWTSVPSDPEPREVLARAAAALRAEERWDRLTELLLRRLPFEDDRQEQLAALGEVATIFRDRLGAPAGALRAGLAALRMSPGDDALWENLRADAAEADAWSELVEGATEAATAAGATPDAARVWRGIARVVRHHLDGERKEDALVAYQRALDAEPDHQETRDEQLAFLRELERWGELVTALRAGAAETQDPARAAALLDEAATLLEHRLGDAPGAIAAYQRVLAIAPASAAAATALERLYESESRWADLAACLERRASLLPEAEAAVPRRRRAQLMADHLGDPAAAADELEELVAADPNDVGTLNLLENIYAREQRHEEYLGTLRRLAELAADPETRAARLSLLAHEGDERPEGAAFAMRAREELLRLLPLDPDAFAALLRDYRADDRFTAITEVLGRRIDKLTETLGADDEAGQNEKRALLVELGEVYERDLNDPANAFDAYATAEAAGDQREEVHEALVRLAERLERWGAAADILRRWAARAPQAEATLRLRAAKLLVEPLDDRPAAEGELLRVLELVPGHAGALAALARVRRQRGDFESAGQLFLDAAVQETDSTTKANLLAEAGVVLQTKLNQEDTAVGLYVQALAADPDQSSAAERLAELYARRQQWVELEPLLDALAARDAKAAGTPDELERRVARHLQRADVALALHNPDKGLTCFQEAFRLQPESMAVLKRFAAFRLQRRDWKEAGDLYVSLRRLHRAALSDEEVLKITLVVAHCRAEDGDIAGAIVWYHDARALDPKHRHALEALARLHAHQKDWNNWVKDRRALLELAEPEEQAPLWDEIGDAYLERLDDRAEAVAAYQAALAAQPGHRPTLHKLLDLYTKRQQWELAAETLVALAAFETTPAVRAKMIYATALIWKDELHRPDEAAALFERALDEAPELPDAFEMLEAVHTESGDWNALAGSYRRMIKRLPAEGVGDRLARLWGQLGTLAIRRLNDRDLAMTAFQVAASLEPDKVRHHETLAEMYGQGGADTRDKAIEAHQALLAHDPNRLASYQALAKLYGEAGAFDKRWCIAATLSFMRKADSTLDALFERLRPRQVRFASQRFTDETWRRVLHPDEDRLLDTLFAMSGAMIAAPAAQTLAAHGLKRKEQVDLERDPRPLVRALIQVASTLDVPMPDLFLADGADSASTILNLKGKGSPRPALLLGPSMIRREDPFELAFDTSKLMSFLRPERFLRHALVTPAALGTALQALFILTRLAPAGTAGEAQRLATHLRKTMPLGAVEQLTPVARRLFETRGAEIDMNRWLTATELSAARVALLICGDLGAAARVIWGEATPNDGDAATKGKERLKDLIAFSISEEYFTCRAQLGLTVGA